MKKVLFVATVVKTHIMEFHIPYLKMFKEEGWRLRSQHGTIMRIRLIV